MIQLKALLWKNSLLKRRQAITSLLEVVLPAALLLVLVYGYRACPVVVRPGVTSSDKFVVRVPNTTSYQTPTDYMSLLASQSDSYSFLVHQMRNLFTSPKAMREPLVIPPFDAYIESMEYVRKEITSMPRMHSVASFYPLIWHLQHHGRLAFVGDLDDDLFEMIRYFNATNRRFSDYFMGVFQNEAEYIKTMHERDSGELWALVVIHELNPAAQTFSYTIRMNSSLLPRTQRVVNPFPKGFETDFSAYYISGFLTLQRMLDTFFTKTVEIDTGSHAAAFVGQVCASTLPPNMQKYFSKDSLSEEEMLAVGVIHQLPPVNRTKSVNIATLYFDHPCMEEQHTYCHHHLTQNSNATEMVSCLLNHTDNLSWRCSLFTDAFSGACASAISECSNATMDGIAKCLWLKDDVGGPCAETRFMYLVTQGYSLTIDVCAKDTQNFCSMYGSGSWWKTYLVGACLRAHLSQLSESCAIAVRAVGGPCATDIDTFCPSSPRYSPLLCLHTHASELSAKCGRDVYGFYAMLLGGTDLVVTQVIPSEEACMVIHPLAFFHDDAYVGAPFPVPPYHENQFYTYAGSLIGLTIALCFMFPMSVLTRQVVSEKEIGMRDLMVSIGLDRRALFASWVITGTLTLTLCAFCASVVTKFGFMEQISFTLVFVVLWMFGVSLVALSMLFAVFFTKARMAAAMAPIGLFVMLLPKFVLPADASYGQMAAASLASPSAAAFTLDRLLSASRLGIDVGWGFAVTDGSYSVLTGMDFILLDTVLYLTLAAIFDAGFTVLARQGGNPLVVIKKFIQKSWRGYQSLEEATTESAEEMSSVGGPGPAAKVVLHALTKHFFMSGRSDPIIACDAVTANLHENSVNVLLGHNGAGKSTLVSMLCGALTPTSGGCRIYGRELEDARRDIGVCPQQNVLIDSLTVREHLLLFGSIKGLPVPQQEAHASQLIHAVDLHAKSDVVTSALSGGMMRRLCTAIAFVGDPKLVILDEPTAGVDPVARRHIWELLRVNTRNRVILLTTHFLDEAELLSDYVIIMNEGKVRASGTPLDLKTTYGTGYTLTFGVYPTCDVMTLTQAVQVTIPDAVLVSHAGNEVAFSLPLGSSPRFPILFARLDQSHMQDLRVSTYGVSCSKLSDVFMNVIAMKDDETPQDNIDHEPDPIGTPEERISRLYGRRLFFAQCHALFAKRMLCTWRDTSTLFFQTILPILAIVLSMQLLLTYFLEDQPRLLLSPSMFDGDVDGTPFAGTATMEDMSSQLYAEYFRHAAHRYGAVVTGAVYASILTNETITVQNFSATVIFHNTTAPHALPTYLNLFTLAALRRVPGHEHIRIEVSVEPLPASKHQEQYYDAVTNLISAVFVLVPFTFIPANFVSFMVREKESGARHLQRVSGVTPMVYWMTSYVWDMFVYSLITFLTLAVFQMYGKSEFVGTWTSYGATVSLFLVYGLSSTAMCYFFSLFFTQHTTAQSTLMMVNFTCGFLLVVAANILDMLPDNDDNASVKGWNKSLTRFFRLMPSFALGEGMLDMSALPLWKYLKGHDAHPWDFDILGRSFLYMITMTPIFLTMTIVAESYWHKLSAMVTGRSRKKILRRLGPSVTDEVVDDDVLLEAVRTEMDDKITVRNLCHAYLHPPHVALHNLSFGIRSGEIFALIGPNGAGKTSALSIMSGELSKTEGEVRMCGFDAETNGTEVRRRLGCCTQRGGLMDHLTPTDHLRLFARTRGLSHAERHIQRILTSLGLTPYRDFSSATLSGGNKRKLCVAIALVSFPEIVFLDEPSSGMDPVSRRSMWGAVRMGSHEGSCMILTTHHFEEVESLAHRIGILHNGTLACVGSLQHLKERYGRGYELLVRVPGGQGEVVAKFLSEHIPGTTLDESHHDILRFSVPTGTSHGSVGDLFDVIERVMVPKFGLVEYSVTQATLEHIFVKVTHSGV